MKTCLCCEHYFVDNTCGYFECLVYEDMTEEQIDKHFTNNEPDCPFFKQRIEYGVE